MSLYDKAKVFFSAAAGAGGEGVAYNIKPVEKLKVDERITNGSFDNNDADGAWVLLDSPTISNNQAVFYDDSTGTNASKRIYQDNVFEDGKTYKVSFEVIDLKAGRVKVGTGFNTTAITKSDHITKSGKYSFYYTAQVVSNADARIQITRTDTTGPYDFKIDNVSVREVEQKANDFSFVRASDLTATYEGPDGLIKKTRENLIEYSNDFSKWTYNPSVHNAPVSGQTGYDGSTDAWLIDKVTSDNSYLILPTPFNYTGVFTWSMYAKNESGANNGLHMYTPAGQAKFDLTGSGSVVSPSYANISATIESIGSGWFRCSFAADGTFTTTNQPRFKVVDTAGDNSTGKIYVQHAQLEQGLVATPYIHRTDSYSKSTAGIQEDEPRYDYSLDNALPPVLMLEPERTNKLTHSEYFGAWAPNGVDLDLGYEAPDGTNSAYKISNTGGSPDPYLVKSGSVLSTDSRSIWAKTVSGTGTVNLLSYYDNTNNLFTITNDWQRFEISSVTTSSGQNNFYAVDFRGDSTLTEVLIWGAQAEEGPYATSYIPTYGSAATREGEAHSSLSSFRCELDKPLTKKYTFVVDVRVDNLERPNNNFDDIFAARSKGTIFTDYAFRIESYGSDTDDDDIADTFSLRVFSYKIGDTGSGTTTPHTNGIQLGVRNKIAIVFDEDSGIKIFVNGNSTPMAESTEPGQMHEVHFLEGGGNPRSKTFLYGVQAYDEALSDAECVSLTTIS